MTSGSLTARLAFSASLSASQALRVGEESSKSSYTIDAPSTRLPISSRAILITVTIDSVWVLALPVRGSEETILIGPINWLGPATAGAVGTITAPDGFAAGDASGDAAGADTTTVGTGGGDGGV